MQNRSHRSGHTQEVLPDRGHPKVPVISLPKGGGALRSVGEKFAAIEATGTGRMSVPVATTLGRSGFGPQLSLSYDSNSGNGPFGLGWSLSLPSISRKTDKGLPTYRDAEESDVFILSGAEDLAPILSEQNGRWARESLPPRVVNGVRYRVERYRPRAEGLFARIERWTNITDPEEVFWRSVSKDNITSWYGRTAGSRIADPADPRRIFSWLICETHDDKGNVIAYGYKPEDNGGVDEQRRASERNRVRTANRYPKRIRYGNQAPYFPRLEPDSPWPSPPGDNGWFFEVVFDYGEHDAANPKPDGPGVWPARDDPFSSYRAGFEVRSYRLCQRVLMFHHFPGEEDVGAGCLVRSTDFTYSSEENPTDVRNPILSTLVSVGLIGYKRRNADGYFAKALPPVEFTYSQASVQSELLEPEPESLEDLPNGIDRARHQWVDLDGEGAAGILTEQAGAWFYKPNLSQLGVAAADGRPSVQARFGPAELVSAKPAQHLGAGAQFLDLAGDGSLDLTQFDGPAPGFYERAAGQRWENHRAFRSLPVADWDDPNLRFIDLSGDGHADILISEEDAFVWHPSLAEEGFAAAHRISRPRDEERGPRVVFADAAQSVHLADMSGDGLTDIVRIRNGEVCYWPSLGYGRFGAKVTMDDAPWFDEPERFSQSRILLADVDGSGVTDILYLRPDGVRVYFNQSGNGWSTPTVIEHLPSVDDATTVQALDLLGNGTACLVWSSPLPGDARRPIRYIDLMGGQKPHLLVKVNNNLGAETQVQYAPSTRFYLRDKQAGRPWATKLPFPVHCVEKVTVTDKWRQTVFTSTYSYHHGYFDGVEREFRGFGRVEQVDVESYGEFRRGNSASPYITADLTLYQPPVKTITWYHTGAPSADGADPLSQFQHEFFPHRLEDERPEEENVLGGFRERALPRPHVTAEGPGAAELSADEHREAARACKGMLLRQEVYELDVDALERGEYKPVRLFSTAYHNCHVRRLQPKASNPHAVFLVLEGEALTYHYELDLRPAAVRPDPRVAHTINLRFDEYGNPLQAVSVVYPRRGQFEEAGLGPEALSLVRGVQREMHVAYTETRYTNDHDPEDEDNYRLRVPCEVLAYELTGILPEDGDGGYFTPSRLRGFRLSQVHQAGADLLPVEELPYHRSPAGGSPQKRVVEHVRTLFFRDDAPALDSPLPFGRLGRLGLPYETYRLALTTDLLDAVFSDAAGNKLDRPTGGPLSARQLLGDADASGYLSGDNLAERFAPVPPSALAGQYWIRSGVAGFAPDAFEHFYLPEIYTDPFGNITTLAYDSRDLFVASSTDAAANTTRVTRFDFRVMAPREIANANDNLSEVWFDVLGLPAAAAAKGDGDEGDNLAGFDDRLANPEPAELEAFFTELPYDEDAARRWLGNATARHVYDLGETRNPDGSVNWAVRPAGACQILRERHMSQLAPGERSPLQSSFEYSDGLGAVSVKKVQAEPEERGRPLRWVTSGKTVLNNKGKPVKQFEPYFSSPDVNHRFEGPREEGVTPIFYYDAAGRTVRTEAPDGSYSRVEFSPWHVKTYDPHDTLKEAGNAWLARKTAPTASAEERRAAELAAEHTDTPALTALDSLGREVVSVAHNRVRGGDGAPSDERYVTYTKLDAEGKPLWVRDARRNLVMQYVTPPAVPNQPGDPAGFVPCYDIAGNLLYQRGMDAGDRWLLHDAAGQPMLSWDGRGRSFRVEYDELRRPVASFVTGADASDPARALQFERIVYGDDPRNGLSRQRTKQLNLRGRPLRHHDSAGLLLNMGRNPSTGADEAFDFKGNLLRSTRQLTDDYKGEPDWSQNPALQTESFTSSARYDALNRPVQLVAPCSDRAGAKFNVLRPGYNEAGLLERMDAWLEQPAEPAALLDSATATRRFVSDIDYNAKGQRVLVEYGAGAGRVVTTYEYDPETFRLSRLVTTRPEHPADDRRTLQDLSYTYDAVGNVTHVRDRAHERVFHSNACVEPGGEYRYDALYRLVAAAGREHVGNEQQPDWDDRPRRVANIPNDCRALRNYVETYAYDAVSNILRMSHHQGRDLDRPGPTVWNQRYQYAADSNRLRATRLPGDPDNLPVYTDAPGYSARYSYDGHGNMTAMPHLASMQWDFRDQLRATQRQVVDDGPGERTFYVYDAGGQRVRKVTERANGTRREERIYLGGFEVYRRYDATGQGVALERETLHVMDDSRRVALVETRTRLEGDDPAPRQLVRYQHGDHLGSSALEVDADADVISYEEYHPYGGTAYQAARNQTDTPKRYRYTAKERDDETGLYYHGARYYAPWLGRWTKCDPAGIDAGMNLYEAHSGNPVNVTDPTGAWPEFVDKGLAKAQSAWDKNVPKGLQESVRGAGRSELQAAKEMALDALGMTAPGQFVNGVATGIQILTSKDPLGEAYAVGKDRVTSIDPPAAMGFALVEGRGLMEGVDDAVKKVPFAQSAEDLRKTVQAARSGDTSGVIEHASGGARHFTQDVGRIVGAVAGGEEANKPPRPSPKPAPPAAPPPAAPPPEHSAPAAGAPSNVKPDVFTHELFRTKTKGPKHGSKSPGYDRRSDIHQDMLQKALRWWSKPGPVPKIGDLHLGHAGTPKSRLRPGQETTLKGQLASENTSQGAKTERAERKLFYERSRQMGLNPHDPANPLYVRPRTKRK